MSTPVPAASNRPADVPAIDPETPPEIALTPDQIAALDQLIAHSPWANERTWARQADTGEIALVNISGALPSAEEIGTALGEPVTMTTDPRMWRTMAAYRLDRARGWCSACRALNRHDDYCDQLPIVDRPLSFDTVEAIGLDGTGHRADERFPYRWSNLTHDEQQRVELLPGPDVRIPCPVCGRLIDHQPNPGCPLCGEYGFRISPVQRGH
jgi:rubrerythrin